jgi:hypothetical protein
MSKTCGGRNHMWRTESRVEDRIPDSLLFIDSFLANIGIRKNHTSQKDSFLFIDSAKKEGIRTKDGIRRQDGIVLGVPLDSKKSSTLFCDWYIT